MIGSQQFKVSNGDSIFTKKLKYCAINDKEEFHLALLRTPVGKNLFLDRVPRCLIFFDVKQNGVIDFEEFMYAISVFHPGASIEVKINFALRLYDLRQTGFIEREEVSLGDYSQGHHRQCWIFRPLYTHCLVLLENFIKQYIVHASSVDCGLLGILLGAVHGAVECLFRRYTDNGTSLAKRLNKLGCYVCKTGLHTSTSDEAKKLAAAALSAVKDAAAAAAIRGKVEITDVRDFAGRDIEVKKLVDAESKEAVEKGKSSAPSTVDAVLEQIKKKQKRSVLDKTKKDWGELNEENKGLEDELQIYKKSSNQYLERVSFLQRTDYKEIKSKI
ncbi:Calcineurin B-like protein 9 [Linum perenne]